MSASRSFWPFDDFDLSSVLRFYTFKHLTEPESFSVFTLPPRLVKQLRRLGGIAQLEDGKTLRLVARRIFDYFIARLCRHSNRTK